MGFGDIFGALAAGAGGAGRAYGDVLGRQQQWGMEQNRLGQQEAQFAQSQELTREQMAQQAALAREQEARIAAEAKATRAHQGEQARKGWEQDKVLYGLQARDRAKEIDRRATLGQKDIRLQAGLQGTRDATLAGYDMELQGLRNQGNLDYAAAQQGGGGNSRIPLSQEQALDQARMMTQELAPDGTILSEGTPQEIQQLAMQLMSGEPVGGVQPMSPSGLQAFGQPAMPVEAFPGGVATTPQGTTGRPPEEVRMQEIMRENPGWGPDQVRQQMRSEGYIMRGD